MKRNIYLRTQREKNELFISNLNFLGYTPKKQKEYQRILIKIHNHQIIGDEFNLSSFFILIELKENSGTIFGKLLKKGIIIKPGKTQDCPDLIRAMIETDYDNQKFIQDLKDVLNF